MHIVGILADPWLKLGVLAAFIPFVSTWRSGAVAWVVVAMYLVVEKGRPVVLDARPACGRGYCVEKGQPVVLDARPACGRGYCVEKG